MGEKIIKLENVSHIYNKHDGNEILALDNINLTVNKGEFVAIIGANGSGKSTLAKHLNAILVPSSGKCFVKGLDTTDPNHLWNIRQTVGMVFQNPDNQIIAALVEEDVAFGPENLGVKPKEIVRRVREALKTVEMLEYCGFNAHLLSGGQKQRVAIAGVLAMDSECLALDEPTALLDPRGRQEVLNTVHKLNKEKKITVIYITHFMEEAVTADRVIVMNKGQIIGEGTPKEIFSQVEQLKKIDLDVPVAAQIAKYLKESGIDLPQSIITSEELAVALCP